MRSIHSTIGTRELLGASHPGRPSGFNTRAIRDDRLDRRAAGTAKHERNISGPIGFARWRGGVGSERPVLHNPHTSIAVLILFVGPLWRDPDIARLNIGELRKFRRQLLELQSGYLLI